MKGRCDESEKRKNPNVIKNFLEYLSKKKTKGHWPCYCRSGKKIRDCHFDVMKEYKTKIKRQHAQLSLSEILNFEKYPKVKNN
ncbi:MAG: hypothetical protein ABIF18_00960 [archaeon]